VKSSIRIRVQRFKRKDGSMGAAIDFTAREVVVATTCSLPSERYQAGIEASVHVDPEELKELLDEIEESVKRAKGVRSE